MRLGAAHGSAGYRGFMSNALRAEELAVFRGPEYKATDGGLYSGKVYQFPMQYHARRGNIGKSLLGALFVTLGLTAGAYALVSPEILRILPVPHIAFAFFVPFATLLYLTDFRLTKLLGHILKGFSSVVLIAAISFAVAKFTDKAGQASIEQPNISYTSVG
jgi:hypothetical protein